MTASTIYDDATFLEKSDFIGEAFRKLFEALQELSIFFSVDLGKQELTIYMPMFPFLRPWRFQGI